MTSIIIVFIVFVMVDIIISYCTTNYFIHSTYKNAKDQLNNLVIQDRKLVTKERIEAVKHIDDSYLVLCRELDIKYRDITKKLATKQAQYIKDMKKEYEDLMDALLVVLNERIKNQ